MQIDKEKLAKFSEERGIRFIVLFGSRAKSEKGERVLVREDSDFDIAVLTLPEKNIGESMNNYNDILFGLCDILGIPDYKMDLTNLNDANILLRRHITSTGVLLCGDRTDYEELKAFAFRDYIDAGALFNLENLLIHKKQKLIAEALK